jgi:predicted metal-binding protein
MIAVLRKTMIQNGHLEKLVQIALSMGASDAKAILSSSILVEDNLAELCVEPRCSNYGLSPSCPPHVSGPSGFRKLKDELKYTVVIRVIIPSEVLLSSDSREWGRYLHELVAGIEQEAIRMGYPNSIAFAGGSCKQIFCREYLDCQKLIGSGECRYPGKARSSMSGYGINVFSLMETCEWDVNLNTSELVSKEDSMSWIAGLVMIG